MTEKKEEKEVKAAKKEVKAEAKEKKAEAKPTAKESPAEKKEVKDKEPAKEEKPKTAVKVEKKSSDDEEVKQTNLVDTEKYLNTGSHIGTKFKSGDMRKYIYKVRKDGLNVLDVQTLDQRLGFASKFIANFPKNQVVVVSRKVYGQTPAKAFADSIGANSVTGRFVPGTFTNPESNHFVEPKVVVITDPEADSQAIKEASTIRVPVVALASTNNSLRNIDLAIPINNKGKKSLALGYWILAKEILKAREEIKADTDFSKNPEDFEYKMTEEGEDKKSFRRKPFRSFGRGPPNGRSGQRGRR
ncbi:MAG: 30S ribosomal protein S2 [Candidatus Diapherotrites archaeon]|uniref:Small ribosomal subunit protein uS2 n=1 Tax=Candidatus Iainarchaeum sp. TaxID=3101447 RepID=A0A2D6LP92_9ARCH|nr:30S ribosomal protein S2 [Candidatus Diapherotrites archaeon]|tara:strand:+ start:13858 stop:14760 length:903 start_codon:yes stop_codon:yes gene_type:complete